MRIGKRKLRMSSGEIRTFKSEGARERFEGYVQAHGLSKSKKGRKRVIRRKLD